MKTILKSLSIKKKFFVLFGVILLSSDAQQSAGVAENLNRQVSVMQEMIGQFKL
jgi:hypothetical protein